jgi:DNA-binding response OmpR family regulator
MSSPASPILVVEDEALIALSIESQLQDMGFETIIASSVEQAEQVLRSVSIRLAILDYKVSDKRTTQIAEGLRAKGTPFIVCSGSQFNDMASIFEDASVVSKPYSDDALRAAVLGAIGPE